MVTGGSRGGRRGKLATTGLRPEADKLKDLHELNALLAEGAVQPVTDRVFGLDEIVEAHSYVEQEVKAGNVAVAMPVAGSPALSVTDAAAST